MVVVHIVMTENLCTEFDLVFCRKPQSIFLLKISKNSKVTKGLDFVLRMMLRSCEEVSILVF